MANDVTSNPIRIDTFGSDVTIDSGSIFVSSIVVTAYSSDKTIAFTDKNGNEVARWETPTGKSTNWTPSQPFNFQNGLILDDSASDLAAGDYVYIYKDL